MRAMCFQAALRQPALARSVPPEKMIKIAEELLSVEYPDLKSAGFTASMLRDKCHATAKQLKVSGFSAAEVKEAYPLDCSGLAKLGFCRDELLDANFSFGDIINTGDPRYTIVSTSDIYAPMAKASNTSPQSSSFESLHARFRIQNTNSYALTCLRSAMLMCSIMLKYNGHDFPHIFRAN
jgi:hypothetical protein